MENGGPSPHSHHRACSYTTSRRSRRISQTKGPIVKRGQSKNAFRGKDATERGANALDPEAVIAVIGRNVRAVTEPSTPVLEPSISIVDKGGRRKHTAGRKVANVESAETPVVDTKRRSENVVIEMKLEADGEKVTDGRISPRCIETRRSTTATKTRCGGKKRGPVRRNGSRDTRGLPNRL